MFQIEHKPALMLRTIRPGRRRGEPADPTSPLVHGANGGRQSPPQVHGSKGGFEPGPAHPSQTRPPQSDLPTVLMMSPGSNFSAEGAEDAGKQCVVNDQMEAFIVIYILIFIISLCGSLMSVWTFIHSPTDKRSGSVYLLNLLAADLLLLLALPFKILRDLRVVSWSLMLFHCQASAVLIYISLYASVVFLAFIITNCYLQDCHGVHALRLQELGFARLLSVVIWLLLLLIMVPNMALPIQEVEVSGYLSCSSLKTDLGLHWHALTVFLCTALFLNASAVVLASSGLSLKRLLGSRGDPGLWADSRRVAVSVTAAAAAYVLSFVPYHVVRTPYTLAQTNVISDCQTKRRLFLGKESTLALALVHVCLHPLLYYYLHPPFRRTAQRLMTWRRREGKDGGGAGGGAPTQVENQEEERFNPKRPKHSPSTTHPINACQ